MSMQTAPANCAHTCHTNWNIQEDAKPYAPPKPPILPTESAYINVRRGRRDAFGRLGNGHHSRFIRTCNSNAHRTFHKLHTHGETRTGTQGLADGPGRVQAAIPIQRIIEDHHHRQRMWIRSTPWNIKETQHQRERQSSGIFRRFRRFMAERNGWKRKQTHQKIHSKESEFWWVQPQTYHEYSKEIEQKTKGKTQFRYTDKLFLQNFSLILHLLLDSTTGWLFKIILIFPFRLFACFNKHIYLCTIFSLVILYQVNRKKDTRFLFILFTFRTSFVSWVKKE